MATDKPAAPRGRPSEYSDVVALAVCERLADGESLRAVCRDEGMPSKTTIFKWLAAHRDFADHYARACEARADSHADDITEIADDPELDPNDKRIRIDARKWLASKLKPKKYGDKVQLAGDGGGPIATVDQTALAKLSDEDLDRLIDIQHKLAAAPGASG